MRLFVYCSGIGASLFLLSCAHQRPPPSVPLSNAEVIRLAEATAVRNGEHLTNYEQPELRFELDDGTWSVFFIGKDPKPGNHFLVVVSVTGGTRYVPGH